MSAKNSLISKQCAIVEINNQMEIVVTHYDNLHYNISENHYVLTHNNYKYYCKVDQPFYNNLVLDFNFIEDCKRAVISQKIMSLNKNINDFQRMIDINNKNLNKIKKLCTDT